MWMITAIVLAAFALAKAIRTNNLDDFVELMEDLVTCNALGQGAHDGMSVTWGVAKGQCMEQCGPTDSTNDGRYEATYDREFTKAFTVSFDSNCLCSAGDKQIVRFKPKNKAQAEMCDQTPSPDDIKLECWTEYKKARGTRFSLHSDIRVPNVTVPFSSKDFEVKRGCSQKCDDCNSVKLPGALDGWPHENLVDLGKAIQMVMCGKTEDLSDILQALIKHLVPDDLDLAEFAAIDIDQDGKLSLDELVAFYACADFTPKQIEKFFNVADTNDDHFLDDMPEFHAFKEEMRNFNPEVDLVLGPDLFERTPEGAIVKVQAKWTAECMKHGKPVDAAECEGTVQEALCD